MVGRTLYILTRMAEGHGFSKPITTLLLFLVKLYRTLEFGELESTFELEKTKRMK